MWTGYYSEGANFILGRDGSVRHGGQALDAGFGMITLTLKMPS